MTINIADNTPRVSYAVAQGVTQTSFTVSFEFFAEADLNVYIDGTLKTLTTDYTVTGGDGSTGTVTMTVVGATGGSTVVITREIALERTTDFPPSGAFQIGSLNTELDRFTAISADLNDEIGRSLRLTDYDAAANLTLPDLDTRKGKTLAFNATTGAVESGPSVTGVTTVAAAAADIATLADIEDGTVATDAISDTAAIASNVTTVANISGNVTTAAGISANITSVAGNETNINTVAANDANVTTVAGINSDITTAAGISSDITAVAGDATDIGTVSTNISNVNTVAGISADVTTVAADGTDIGVVAGLSSNLTTVSGISANVTTVAGISSDVTAVAGDATDIGTVATNIANVNTAAGISADITTVAGISADVTTAATNAADITAVADEVSKVISVANDLAEATSEIDVVAGSIANVDLVGGSIANVNTVASNLTNVNSFANTYFISANAPSSPTEGDLWFDTTNDIMKVYDGNGFVNAGSSVNGTSSRNSYTATAGQTSFAATYDAGFVDVYLNGIKLIDGSDFTATSGSAIVLSSGAALNDTVDIVAYGTFELLNTELNDLTDASTSGASSGDVLTYNGTVFAPAAPTVPTLSSLSIANHDQVTVTSGGAVTATSFAGDGSSLTGIDAFASGTKMLFGQTAAPTGWTKITTDDDAALRIVSGTVGSGGSSGLSTALATPTVTGTISGSTGSHTLSVSEMPSHTHSSKVDGNLSGSPTGNGMAGINGFRASTAYLNNPTGGGGSHSHSLSATFSGGTAAINVKYVDVIMASKD